MLQVLSNLLDNAIKFTSEGGWVSLEAGRVGRAVRFSVADCGRGIHEEELEHVFEWSWRADRTTSSLTPSGSSSFSSARRPASGPRTPPGRMPVRNPIRRRGPGRCDGRVARIALFVLAVGGLAYLLIGLLNRWLDLGLGALGRASLAVIVGLILWTLVTLRYADRLGGGDPSDR